MSQTITSDLDADLQNMSYKKHGVAQGEDYYAPDVKLDENDYLNGSTAGFGKKLREINREIHEEQLEQDLQEGSDEKPSEHIKIKNGFNLNLDKIKKEQTKKYLQSDLKIKINDRKDGNVPEYQRDIIVQNFNKHMQN